MNSITIKHASGFSQPVKAAIESLFGHYLSGGEQISIMALEGHPAPSGSERQTAAAHLNEVLERMANRTLKMPMEEFEAAR